MATVTPQQVKYSGVVLTTVAATAGPDKVKWGEDVALLITNGSGSAITATVVVPGNTKYGQAEPDVTSASIAATKQVAFGPFPKDLADDNGDVSFTVSAATSVTYAAIRV
ncbi:hypothetical protein VSH64_24865 [Amycolatopsis rhabdoformis]|uniref:DUF2190 family protein n=1 Tax=Amycolatopsis rhabdoformis TaxID=1448059 RepID=A0ABZ1HXL4_9PSEU|nr:hypothetical protein [Amycolatopsis rhabdoformis]WSE26110.1 hypothetical protein VSH64_24865 [Amycolatopsis rhabdoformis]